MAEWHSPGPCSDVEPGLSHGLTATPLCWVTKANYGDRTILVLGHHSLGSKGKTSEASRLGHCETSRIA